MIIVSHDAFNRVPTWRSVIVVPISTAKAQARRGPTAPLLPKGTAGLKRDSVALCHQVSTLDRAKLARPIGALPRSTLREVEGALKAALDLP